MTARKVVRRRGRWITVDPEVRAPAEQARLMRRGFWLEYASMAWMTVEAAVAIASGIIASSVALLPDWEQIITGLPASRNALANWGQGKRLLASGWAWVRITSGEHLFACGSETLFH
jgi:hypothetical protein